MRRNRGRVGFWTSLAMLAVIVGISLAGCAGPAKLAKESDEALAKGDEVATTGGLLGKVTRMGDSYLTVEIANGVEVQVQRSAVVQVLPKGTIK